MPPQITCPHCGNTINLENRKGVDFEKITYALSKSPKTFTELLAITNLPRKTLSLRLKDLCTSGSIVKDGGYRLNSSIKPTNKMLRKRNGNGRMNRTMLHIGKNVQWIPAALIICLVVVAFGSAMMLSSPSPEPQPPIASFYYAPSSNIVAGRALTFDASLSSGSNGLITDYSWTFGDGSPQAYGKIVTHAYVAEGTYTVILQVTAHGSTTSTQRTVDVSPAPQPATTVKFTISPDPTLITAGWENKWIVSRPLVFDASSFNVSNGYRPYYSWDFGDGATGTGIIVSHAYLAEGTYSATLTVTDLKGAVHSITEQEEILPMPVARIYVDLMSTQYQIGDTITLNIMISNVTDLYCWQAGMTFNPAALECITTTAPSNTVPNATTNSTAFTEGAFLQKSGDTMWLPATVENGVILAHACTLLGPATPASGSGVLATIKFTVKGEGVLNVHLTNVILIEADDTEIPVYVAT